METLFPSFWILPTTAVSVTSKGGQKSPTGYDLTGVQQSGGRRGKQRLGDDFKIKGSLLFSDSSELTKPYKDSK